MEMHGSDKEEAKVVISHAFMKNGFPVETMYILFSLDYL